MQPRKRSVRRLSLESLEHRSLLAGNVSAHVSGGALYIEGDDQANVITVESFAGGAIQVRGFNDSVSGLPTSINETPNGLRLFYGVTGDIVIKMKGGNDGVRVTNLVAPRNLVIDMGAGADELITGRDPFGGARYGGTGSGPLYVQGELQVVMGTEDDALYQSDAHILARSQIDLGGGDDLLSISRPPGSGANVEYFGDLTILPRAGDDTINVTGLISRSVTIHDEAGPLDAQMTSMDIYGTLKIVSTGHVDTVGIIAANVRGDVYVESGGGDDVLFFLGIANKLNFKAGDGNDRVTVAPSGVGQLIADLGRGNDLLDLDGLFASSIYARGDDGDDVFNVRNVRATTATFHGDKNTDTYREPIVPPNQIRNLQLFTIERRETF